jgi:hypothetical protein
MTLAIDKRRPPGTQMPSADYTSLNVDAPTMVRSVPQRAERTGVPVAV